MRQLSFEDMAKQDEITVIIHWADARGGRHFDFYKTTKDNYINSVGQWRREHCGPDCHFLGCE